jgi:lipid A disaccharide synthetase
MPLMTNSLDRIPQFEPINKEIGLEELVEKMKYISQEIAEEYNVLNNIVSQVNIVLNNNYNTKFMNTDFDNQEYIEENLDRLVHEYQTVKELLKRGREIRYYKELKEREKDNENRCARNILVDYGIKINQ